MTQLFIIILDHADDGEREAVQAIVKDNAERWWHRLEDIWFVVGRSSGEWRDLVKPVIKQGPSSVLVMALPAKGDRRWAYFGPKADERLRWLHNLD